MHREPCSPLSREAALERYERAGRATARRLRRRRVGGGPSSVFRSSSHFFLPPSPSPSMAASSSSQRTSERTTVSAPGKVLLAGGYLVLDPAHRGLVVSTSSRFFTSVLTPAARPAAAGTITVRSPQFIAAEWEYRLEAGGLLVEIFADGAERKANKFVRIALDKTLRVAGELVGEAVVRQALEGGMDIVIAGDNDFYSQRAQVRELGFGLLIFEEEVAS